MRRLCSHEQAAGPLVQALTSIPRCAQASESPLLVATAAGSVALPTLLKLAGLLKDRAQDLVTGEQLPVELELGREFVFRSVFSCPVSREQSSPSNPPMLLPCGHVLCKVGSMPSCTLDMTSGRGRCATLCIRVLRILILTSLFSYFK